MLGSTAYGRLHHAAALKTTPTEKNTNTHKISLYIKIEIGSLQRQNSVKIEYIL